MNTADFQSIADVAARYATTKFDFQDVRVVSVDKIRDSDAAASCRFAVRLDLTYSDDMIELLASQGRPQEIETRRAFLRGAFKLKVVVCGNSVESTEWQDMDLC